MEYVLRQLSCSIVLSKDDISAIRQSIAHRYAQHTKEVRATYLAQALHKAVEKALVGIDHRFWQGLKQSLFKNTLAKHKADITKRDVFHEIVNLDLNQGELNSSTYRWLVTQQVEGVDPGELSDYIRRHLILHGKESLSFESQQVKPISKKEAEIWLAIEVTEEPVKVLEVQSETSNVLEAKASELELDEKPTKGKIKSLEPAPHFSGTEDWPVSYRVSHLGWAIIVAAVLMGTSMIYTILK